jgi:hypothetical protein
MEGSRKLGTESLGSIKGGKMAMVRIIIIIKAGHSSPVIAEIKNKTLYFHSCIRLHGLHKFTFPYTRNVGLTMKVAH